jgi:TonB family protein
MIREFVTSTFVLSPILLLAQASPPAQTKAASPPAETSSLIQPLISTASHNDQTSVTTSTPVRISNGIVAPKLIRSAHIQWSGGSYPEDTVLVVHLTVEPSGEPADVSIVSSTSPTMNRAVLQAVKQYRFQPGMLDNSPYSVPMNLQVVLRNPID